MLDERRSTVSDSGVVRLKILESQSDDRQKKSGNCDTPVLKTCFSNVSQECLSRWRPQPARWLIPRTYVQPDTGCHPDTR